MVDSELELLPRPNAARRVARISRQAPFDGWAMPSSEIPDAVFSTCMLGNGIGIGPSGSVLCAPCAGTVTMVRQGETVTVSTTGFDGVAAIDALCGLVAGLQQAVPAVTPAVAAPPPPPPYAGSDMELALHGVQAAPGVAI